MYESVVTWKNTTLFLLRKAFLRDVFMKNHDEIQKWVKLQFEDEKLLLFIRLQLTPVTDSRIPIRLRRRNARTLLSLSYEMRSEVRISASEQ